MHLRILTVSLVLSVFSTAVFSQPGINAKTNNPVVKDADNGKAKTYTLLYVFPHPDDESYGPAAAIDKSIKAGHEVHLLTLTKGEATSVRRRLNLTKEEMGETRYKEMLNVERTLNLTSMTVLDYPDGELDELDPREIEQVIHDHVRKIKPDIIITYPVHGISGHTDHIVCHAAVKRVFMELRGEESTLRRLVFWGLTEEDNQKYEAFDYKTIKPEETDCVVKLSAENVEAAHQALDCYVTYKPIIEGSNIKKMVTESISYDFFQESFSPPLNSLTDRLPE